jgi:hypothetical protein
MNRAPGKFQPKDFHTTKDFVLVCRTDPAFKFAFLSLKTGYGKQALSAVE